MVWLLLTRPSGCRRRRTAAVSRRSLAGFAVGIACASTAHAQTAPGTSQSVVGAPETSHPALAATDTTPPQTTEGGPAVPPPADLPQMVHLDDALRMFRARGFGILLAEASVMNAEGAERAASYVPNPQLNAGYGRVLNYPAGGGCPPSSPGMPSNTFGCSPDQFTVGLSDKAAIEDCLSGKRDLRLKVARAALAAAKMSRVDAQRTLSSR